MDPPKSSKHPAAPIARDERLQHMYGAMATRQTLLNHQLEARRYFDSGDFALSQAHRSSDAGAVMTGLEHPLRRNISHPSAPVPSSSNVDNKATQQLPSDEASDLAPASHLNLHHEAPLDARKGRGDASKSTGT